MFFKSKEKKEVSVEFYTDVPALSKIEEARPQLARNFIPQWWKDIPKQEPFPAMQTVKVCPSFPDFFSQGYIVPMWADTLLQYDETTGEWRWQIGSSDNPFRVEFHNNAQFIKYVSPKTQGIEGNFVFKFVSPWYLKTPKGYSSFQLPLFYHFNHEFSVLPGVIHTDYHHVINQQVLYYGKGKEIFIKRGTPLVQYIPFKRTAQNLLVREFAEEDRLDNLQTQLDQASTFIGSGTYRSRFKKFEREHDV